MSGHSKWATTKRHKAAIDAKKGKIFSVLSKELTLAARAGGGDPNSNARLRSLLIKAKGANMPADNVERAIKKGTGEIEGAEISEMLYEGYGPGGVGIMVTVTTDNKNRSASEVRSTFTKHGGNLAGPGSLARFFNKQGQFFIDNEKVAEDKLMELVLENGAEDMKNEGGRYEVLCPIGSYDTLRRRSTKLASRPTSPRSPTFLRAKSPSPTPMLPASCSSSSMRSTPLRTFRTCSRTRTSRKTSSPTTNSVREEPTFRGPWRNPRALSRTEAAHANPHRIPLAWEAGSV
jgi:YebC/PmpR family DNA-binding regulatory protein